MNDVLIIADRYLAVLQALAHAIVYAPARPVRLQEALEPSSGHERILARWVRARPPRLANNGASPQRAPAVQALQRFDRSCRQREQQQEHKQLRVA